MQTRRGWLLVVGISALTLALGPTGITAEVASFRDRLHAGLKTRTKAERAFVDRVADMVEDGDLPQTLVDRVFFWARKKARKKGGAKAKRPMIYFTPALVRLAKKMDIEI